jgi:hypothetical protein
MFRIAPIVLLLMFGWAPSADASDHAHVDVMTQNQYLGADLAPVLQAAATGDAAAFNAAVVGALRQAASNNPAARMAAQAEVIAKRRPDFVALQESFVFACSDPFATGACENPAIAGAFADFLALTLAALGGEYQEAATVVNLNIPEIPVFLDATSQPIILTVIDRDVILSRAGLETTPADFGCAGYESVDGCNYMVALPAGPFEVRRGYVGVDVQTERGNLRLVNTHLEVKDPPVPSLFQSLQAQELANRLAATTPAGALIVMGDFNSSPDDPPFSPYAQFAGMGYTDTWLLRPGKVGGPTCCQTEALSNQQSKLTDRIDLLFVMPEPVVKEVRVLGATVSSRTHPPGRGLWASDHGAVAATVGL